MYQELAEAKLSAEELTSRMRMLEEALTIKDEELLAARAEADRKGSELLDREKVGEGWLPACCLAVARLGSTRLGN